MDKRYFAILSFKMNFCFYVESIDLINFIHSLGCQENHQGTISQKVYEFVIEIL